MFTFMAHSYPKFSQGMSDTRREPLKTDVLILEAHQAKYNSSRFVLINSGIK